MYHYRIYCMDIVSDIELYQPVKGDGHPDPDNTITIKEGKMPDEFKFDKECYSYIDEKESYLSNYCCYLYIPDEKTIIYEKKEGRDHTNLGNYVLGWGMAMLFFERNTPIIHCSAVYNDKGAFLLSGSSGSGKSTLTTSLLDNGLKFLADDTSMVAVKDGKAYAHPCYPFRKLCRDVVEEKELNPDDLIYIDEDKDKFAVPWTEFFPDHPVPIKALIYMEHAKDDDPGVKVREVTGLEKVNYLYVSLFIERLLKQRNRNKYSFQMCLDLAGLIPIYSVVRPKNVDSRAEIYEKVKSIIDSI